jgi:hypothetical protein
MKITKEELKQIIKEELAQVLAENKSAKVMRRGPIRKGPGAFNKKLGRVKVGDTLEIIDDETKEKWVKVKKVTDNENIEGWISVNLLKKPGKKKPGLAGLKGAKPLGQVEKSVVVTGTKG